MLHMIEINLSNLCNQMQLLKNEKHTEHRTSTFISIWVPSISTTDFLLYIETFLSYNFYELKYVLDLVEMLNLIACDMLYWIQSYSTRLVTINTRTFLQPKSVNVSTLTSKTQLIIFIHYLLLFLRRIWGKVKFYMHSRDN